MLLKFNVDKQILSRTDSEQPVALSNNYLKAGFIFTSDWKGVEKTAVFNDQYPVKLVNDMCIVPSDVINNPSFKVTIFGGDLITTTSVEVKIKESGYNASMKDAEVTTNPWQGYMEAGVNGTVIPGLDFPYVYPENANAEDFWGLNANIEILQVSEMEKLPHFNFLGSKTIEHISFTKLTDFNDQILQLNGCKNIHLPAVEKIWAFEDTKPAGSINIFIGENVQEININAFTKLNKDTTTIYFDLHRIDMPNGYPWGAPNATFIFQKDE